MVASLVPIWSHKYFPTQTGPGYLLIYKMLKDFYDPTMGYFNYYVLKTHLLPIIPNVTFNLLVYLFHFIFPILTAYKIVLSLHAILLPLSIFYLLKVIDSRKLLLGFIGFLYFYHWDMFKGHHQMCFSIPIFFFIFGYWIKHAENLNFKNIILLNIGIVLLYLTHLFSFCLLVFTIFIDTLFTYKSIKKACYTIILLFVPSFILLGQYAVLTLTQSTWNKGGLEYYSILWRIKGIVTKFWYCFSPLELLIGWLPFSFIYGLILKKILNYYTGVPTGNESGFKVLFKQLISDRWLRLLIVLCVLYLVLPSSVLSWKKANLRLIPFLYIFALCCGEMFRNKVISRIFLVITILMTLLQYTIININIGKANNLLNTYTSGISVIEKNSVILPISVEPSPQIGEIRPICWAHNYYNIFKGGVTGFSMGRFNTQVPIWYKHYPIEDNYPLFNRKSPEQNIARIKEVYDYIVLWGEDPKVFNLFEENGFVVVHNQGKLRVYKNIR
jgi:hypothetical protein